VVLFCSLSLIALDLAWRVLKIQFDTLLIYAFASDVTAAIVVILIALATRRSLSRRRARSLQITVRRAGSPHG
ncbi:MAG: hypothetical protein ACREE1_15265, partial [Stellaceae bacterium]